MEKVLITKMSVRISLEDANIIDRVIRKEFGSRKMNEVLTNWGYYRNLFDAYNKIIEAANNGRPIDIGFYNASTIRNLLQQTTGAGHFGVWSAEELEKIKDLEEVLFAIEQLQCPV